MPEYLPPIRIGVTSPLRQFLARMADIAEKSGAFTVERHFGALGDPDFDIVNFRSTKPSPHVGLGVQLISRPDPKDIVAVEVIAERWRPNDPPSYATYVSEAKALIQPLLSNYNREANARHRMSIATMKSLEPKLPPRVRNYSSVLSLWRTSPYCTRLIGGGSTNSSETAECEGRCTKKIWHACW